MFNFNAWTAPSSVKTHFESTPNYVVNSGNTPIDITQTDDTVVDLMLNLAIPHDRNQDAPESYVGNVLDGFFTPTVTADYTFYAACDDACSLWINDTNTLEDATKPQWVATKALISYAEWSYEFNYEYRDS